MSLSVIPSPWQFSWIWGVNEPLPDGRVGTRLVARILMAPLHAKALAMLLAEHVRAYEAAFGELPDPTVGKTITAEAIKQRLGQIKNDEQKGQVN